MSSNNESYGDEDEITFLEHENDEIYKSENAEDYKYTEDYPELK